MEYGEERGWWERTGGRIYEREEWKKIPTERFQNYAEMAMEIVSVEMAPPQREWLASHIFLLPSYETHNPFATVLGFIAIEWSTKKLSHERFKKASNRYGARFKVRPSDILRYARKWQDSWLRTKN